MPHAEVAELAIEMAVSAGTATLVLRGELDAVTRPLLAQGLAQVLADGPEQLVLDLAGVTFIDCASARLINGAGRHLPAGARMVISSPGVVVRRVFVLTGLAERLEGGPTGGGRGGC